MAVLVFGSGMLQEIEVDYLRLSEGESMIHAVVPSEREDCR